MSLPYRDCVGAMVINEAGLVFVGRRIDTTVEAWQMPQGGIDAGETPEVALHRELREEIGTGAVEILGQTRDWLTYDLPPHLLGKIWNGLYGGQRQRWFAVRLTGGDELIDIATAEPEFEAWRWAPVETLPDVIVPFKRAVYRQVVAELGHHARPAMAAGGR